MAERAGRDRRINLGEMRATLSESITAADGIRADGLEGLLRLRAVKARQLEREHERLAARLGANHPRVALLESRARANEALRTGLMAELTRVRTEPPPPDRTAWIVHGHIRAGSAAVDRLTVAPADRPGRCL